ncbi:general substrate transporter [Lasiosphaeria miniovina]|uniref:General substrate transporter n=1 Tax=Lasiosphaeria miniovina TaxID=1954250 RepID=A0AA39ZYA8_9PEZI|nr:general substrate transporter [Lasiosphaeria miniovina]KAK0705880.1 general substrate transporter [Lasiosphaeria miniovina]
MTNTGIFSGDGAPGLRGPLLVAEITAVCSAGFLLFGYDQGVMSGVVISESWLDAMGRPSELVVGTITALYDIGAIIGALLAAVTAESLGRKRTLLLGALVVAAGGLLMGAAPSRAPFMAARVVVGVGVGYTTSVTPVYQSEISAHAQRGWHVCCQLTTMLVGLALAYVINYGLYFRPGSAQWRLPLIFQCAFALFILVLTPFLPDTPRWLVRHRADEGGATASRGLAVLARLRGKLEDDEGIRREMAEIQDAIARESKERAAWADLFRSHGVKADKRLYLAVGIQLMQQASGINIITYYAPTLFTASLGMSQERALFLGCFTQIWYVFASLVTWYTIDRIGRRKLFITMALAMSIILVGEALATATGTRAGAVAAVVCLLLFEACFSWGWMACVWIYPPEILPLSIRAKGSALATAADFLGNWFVVQVTPVGIAKMGWRFYLIWAAFNLVNAVVVCIFYPETGGLQLEAVDHVFTEQLERTASSPATGLGLLVEKLQWAPVRVAAQAVEESKARARRLGEEQGLLEDESTADYGI